MKTNDNLAHHILYPNKGLQDNLHSHIPTCTPQITSFVKMRMFSNYFTKGYHISENTRTIDKSIL